jgi:ABC-type transport system involved in multi-copper enzyme maturation permease subunit
VTTPGLGAVLAVELARMRRHPLTWILSVIAVGFMVFMHVALIAVLSGPPQPGFDPAMVLEPYRALGATYAAALFTGVAAILVVVLAGQSVGGEFTRGTLRTLLANGAGRGAIVAAKIVAVLIAAAVASVAGAGLAIAATYAMGLAAGETFLRADAASLARVPLVLFVGLGAWGVLGAAATFATRSQAAGIGSTLGLLLVGDVVGGLIASLGEAGRIATRALPNWAISRLQSGQGDTNTLLVALVTLAVWTGALTGLAVWQTRRADAIAVTR